MNPEILVQCLHDRACSWLVDKGKPDIPAPTFYCVPRGGGPEHAFPMANYGRTEAVRLAWIRFCRLIIAILEADAYAVQHSVWLVERIIKRTDPVPRTYAEAGGQPSEAPDRMECLFTLVRTREGGRAVRYGDMIRDDTKRVVEVKARDTGGMEFAGTWDELFEPADDNSEFQAMVMRVINAGADDGADRSIIADMLYDSMIVGATGGPTKGSA